MTRILVVASTFPASDTDAAPAFVKDLIIALKRLRPDLQVEVLAPHYLDETPDFVRHDAYDERRFPYAFPPRLQQLAGRGIVPSIEQRPARIALVPMLFLGEAWALWRAVRSHRPDVIYAHWFTPQGVTVAVVSALTGVPWVLTSHANDVRIWRKLPVLGPALVRALLPTAARITAVSQTTLTKMRSFFDDDGWQRLADKVAIIPMGVDIEALTAPVDDVDVLKDRHDVAGKRVVYFIGRLAEKKGVGLLLQSFADADFKDTVLLIAGDGPLRAALEAKREALGLDDDRVRFVGYVSGQQKRELLHLADVVAVPSIETASGDSEGFPVVIMEALAAGKVCLASDATGADSVLRDGESGFVVPQQDVGALTAGLRRALTLDDDGRMALATAAQAAARRLDWAHIAAEHLAFLITPFEQTDQAAR